MSSKIVLINGPKTCGKTEAVTRIKQLSEIAVVDRRCKDHLFILTSSLFRMTMEEFFEHYECRETKEIAKSVFSIDWREYNRLAPFIGSIPLTSEYPEYHVAIALSVREALIYVSEVVCKPAFGRGYFGIARAVSINALSGERSIDDSCGFDDEIAPTIDKLGMDNVMLIRIYGRGSFEGDSRSYIADGVVANTIDLYNTGKEEDFLSRISDIALDFYES